MHAVDEMGKMIAVVVYLSKYASDTLNAKVVLPLIY
jgi:hypothetical protein